MLTLYSFLLSIASLFLLPQAIFRKKYRAGLAQRLGRLPDFDAGGEPVVWLHCVSVGETQAARPLFAELLKNFPEYKLVVSTTTLTGQTLAKEVFAGQAALIFYFPFDWKFAVRRALRRIKPNIILLMETEIWFNFLREAGKTGAKTIIVNGRLSEKSASRYKIIRRTMQKVLRSVTAILAQTNADAQRFLLLAPRGTNIKVTGNIKFDQPFDETESELTKKFRERFSISDAAPLIVVASTHQPEEEWILESFKKVWKDAGEKLPRLLLVPRHPERFNEVTALIKKSGFGWVRRSENESARDKTAEIILLDSIGELRAMYPLAEIVFVGGSLIPHGGQSILEPAQAKAAIVTGFYTMNFKEIVKEFLKRDALIQLPKLSAVEIPEQLAKVFSELLSDREKRKVLAENAFDVMSSNRGASLKTVECLEPFFAAQNKKLQSENSQKELPAGRN
jgi:3-deoxy-D-manno-octulosonic-acid transferase